MSSDIPSTGRRYPQIMVTNVPLDPDPAPDAGNIDIVPVHARLGNFPYQVIGPDGVAGTADDEPAMGGRTIVVQPFGGYQETQIEFCDTRGWGVSQQCDRANVYGFHAGDYQDTWEQPWTPVPVQGDVAGFDRPVQWDVYTSTKRVYVFMDGKPSGVRRAARGRMPAGPVTVAYRAVLYHCGIDETVTPDDTGHKYEHDYSICHSDRHMDDFGIELSVRRPRLGRDACSPAGRGGTVGRERAAGRGRRRSLIAARRRVGGGGGARRRRRPTIRIPPSRPTRCPRARGAPLRRRAAAGRSEQPRRRRSGARAPSASACSSRRRSRAACSKATTTARRARSAARATPAR